MDLQLPRQVNGADICLFGRVSPFNDALPSRAGRVFTQRLRCRLKGRTSSAFVCRGARFEVTLDCDIMRRFLLLFRVAVGPAGMWLACFQYFSIARYALAAKDTPCPRIFPTRARERANGPGVLP